MSSGPEAATLQREYAFSDADFQRVRSLVQARLGISLADSKRELVYGRMSRRLRALGLAGFQSYLDQLEDGNDAELQQFCNAITTNLTAFFRERNHFEFLAHELLPMLERNNADSRRIRMWSAGCSSGEEPYSMAMVALETLHNLPSWDLRILATDIDTEVLTQASEGLYEGERLEKVGGEQLLRWFHPAGGANQFRISEPVRRRVTFKVLNLIEGWPMHGPFDVIFCRNVLIYFDRATQRDIVGRMAQLQHTGDHLFLGHSESLLDVSDDYRLVGQTVYRRRPDASGL